MGVLLLMGSGLPTAGADPGDRRDVHSSSRPEQVRVQHLTLELTPDFASHRVQGVATWTVVRAPGAPAEAPLVLDTRDLTIGTVTAGPAGRPDAQTVDAKLGPADPILGAALTIPLPPGAEAVRITYTTSAKAGALQWLEPAGTLGKKQPFLFSQAQAIQARTFVPCQDTPGVRLTYDATITVPEPLTAVMAAESTGPPTAAGAGQRRFGFRMPQSIPSYLIAFAVGDLEFRKLGERTGVWGEPGIVEKAAWEFADTETMLEAAEALFGPYRWGRYDLLVLPPSFPFGGMENPRLTFATPTVLAGDRSQVALVAHEMAHSWSGNLVTSATWRDFWLNEGFTVYLERRIVERVYGKDRADMESVLGRGELGEELKRLPAPETVLHIDLAGRDPDDGVTRIPYEKGALFLTALEGKVGRERMTAFLKGYFDHFAFQSITTADFEAYLKQALFDGGAVPLDLQAWIHQPGLPADAPTPASPRFAQIEALAKAWLAGTQPLKEIDTKGWSTLEWLQFLRSLPEDLSAERVAQLDGAFHLTETGNAEIATAWLLIATRAGYGAAMPRLEDFLTTVGRRKFLMPLYTELIRTPAGRARAVEVFAKARTGYHPLAVESVSRLLATPAQ